MTPALPSGSGHAWFRSVVEAEAEAIAGPFPRSGCRE
jgi:hypothetical protein